MSAQTGGRTGLPASNRWVRRRLETRCAACTRRAPKYGCSVLASGLRLPSRQSRDLRALNNAIDLAVAAVPSRSHFRVQEGLVVIQPLCPQSETGLWMRLCIPLSTRLHLSEMRASSLKSPLHAPIPSFEIRTFRLASFSERFVETASPPNF